MNVLVMDYGLFLWISFGSRFIGFILELRFICPWFHVHMRN